MTTRDQTYEELSAAAENGELTVSGEVRTGQAAVDYARSLLLEATGAATIEEATQLALGRPRIGSAPRGPSKQWRVRASDELHTAAEELAEREGVTISELVRHAVATYVAANCHT